jgi:uncharacterized membrane protein YqaE (UPF0057 family)
LTKITIMKKIFTLLFLMLFFFNSNAASMKSSWTAQFENQTEFKALTPEMMQLSIDQFLSLTPKKYREMTGQRLGLKKSLELKAAQKIVKKHMNSEPEFSKGLYILLAILGLAWIAIGVMDNWEGSTWIVNLILTLLCWLPGLIHALVKMKDYYGSSK